MEILDLTNDLEIRATLGVSDLDLPAQSLTNFGLAAELTIDLHTWLTPWKNIRDYGGDDEDTKVQQQALSVYAKYFCCRKILSSANFGFLQRRSDGEVEGHRFTEDSLAELRDEFDKQLAIAKQIILGIDSEFTETDDATYSQFARAPASRNVISE